MHYIATIVIQKLLLHTNRRLLVLYHLETDILGLGTPQFNCRMSLRLRAKTIHSLPVYKYGFYAVLKIKPQRITKSIYDLEEKEGRLFPLIIIN